MKIARGAGRSSFHVVLLAGGSGTRFWPLSRARRPKQLLPLAGGRPLLVETWHRARKLAPASRIWVATPQALSRAVRELLPQLAASRVIREPSPRDTAPAITLACAAVARADPHAVVAVLPTDHVIRDVPAFVRCVRVAAAAAARGALVCLGVRPDRPATGFGYLRCAAAPSTRHAVAVQRFVEKPDAARARRFVRSGRYLWNGGMFLWRVDRFLDEARRVAPEVAGPVQAHLDGRRTAWTRARRLSVDYAIMEHARGVEVVALEAGWDDLGSWDAAARIREERGRIDGHHVLLDSPGSAVFGQGRTVALVDLPGVVVVDTAEALLVVPRGSSQRVRSVVEELRRRRRGDLL